MSPPAPVAHDLVAERAADAEALVARAAGDRELLEAWRWQLLQQVHRPGDHPAAAAQLRAVEAALSSVPRRVEHPWTWQQRVRRRARRWRTR